MSRVAGPLVFQHGVAAPAFSVTLGVWVAFEVIMTIRQRRLVGGRPSHDPSGYVVWVALTGSVIAAVSIGRADPLPWPGGRVWPVVAGLALICVGIGLRAWSIATLGPFFQYRIEVQPGHRVVSDGPYRYVRHPSYSGVVLVLIGIALATGDVLSVIVVAVLGSIGLTVRIRAEERQLTDALGAQYERFAAQRKRLVPGVW